MGGETYMTLINKTIMSLILFQIVLIVGAQSINAEAHYATKEEKHYSPPTPVLYKHVQEIKTQYPQRTHIAYLFLGSPGNTYVIMLAKQILENHIPVISFDIIDSTMTSKDALAMRLTIRKILKPMQRCLIRTHTSPTHYQRYVRRQQAAFPDVITWTKRSQGNASLHQLVNEIATYARKQPLITHLPGN